MPDAPPRNTAMEIATALGRADSQSLAGIAFELLESLAEARASLATYRAAEEAERREQEAIVAARRERDAARKRRVRAGPMESDGVPPISADSPSFSPTPPFPTSTASSSSSAREASNWTPDQEAKIAAALLTDADRNALTAVLRMGGNKLGIVAELWMILDGHRANVPRDAAAVGMALQDYAANETKWNSGYFRAYVQRAAKGDRPQRPRGGTGNRTYENAKAALGGAET